MVDRMSVTVTAVSPNSVALILTTSDFREVRRAVDPGIRPVHLW